jgi:hypothetical protein
MPGQTEAEKSTRSIVTERCLIAADVDKTVVTHDGHREREHFLLEVAPELVRAASYGAQLAFLTGNSMHALASRFLTWLIDAVCHTNNLQLLDRFHFFSNSGGVYSHFSAQSVSALGAMGKHEEVLQAITLSTQGARETAIRPSFIDSAYIERCCIPPTDLARLKSLLDDEGRRYHQRLEANRSTYKKVYDLESVSESQRLLVPWADPRIIPYGSDSVPKEASVQITLKPILSFRHALDPTRVFGKDLRAKLIQRIQTRLDQSGLGHYVARPGGRSSIDVTLRKVNKAYALEFLIDRLNLQGVLEQRQQFGSNAIYFGDEVIVGGGNDYPVTRIPGLLIFAVNSDKDLVPFLSRIFVPSAILEGPDATADVLRRFNDCAARLLKDTRTSAYRGREGDAITALQALKSEIFENRVEAKIADLRRSSHLSADDWQALHAFVTLIARKDVRSREWISLLINELDAILTQAAGNSGRAEPALGASTDDN